jgi:hypothetical protein
MFLVIKLIIVMPGVTFFVVTLNVILLNVIMQDVVAPQRKLPLLLSIKGRNCPDPKDI